MIETFTRAMLAWVNEQQTERIKNETDKDNENKNLNGPLRAHVGAALARGTAGFGADVHRE
jgi:hypothetical protein